MFNFRGVKSTLVLGFLTQPDLARGVDPRSNLPIGKPPPHPEQGSGIYASYGHYNITYTNIRVEEGFHNELFVNNV